MKIRPFLGDLIGEKVMNRSVRDFLCVPNRVSDFNGTRRRLAGVLRSLGILTDSADA